MNITDSITPSDLTQHVVSKPEIHLVHDLPEDPEKLRWRAWWTGNHYFDSDDFAGIDLVCYPVIRKTKRGAWIDPYSCRQATKQPWEDGAPGKEWVSYADGSLRWVSDNSGASWAKPTREEAIESLAIRLSRHAVHVRRQNANIAKRAAALLEMRPDLSSYATFALGTARSAD